MKTVKEVSHLSGVSIRTLHYYDKIGLLKPTIVAENGYRYYDGTALSRLQMILYFRDLSFPLETIKTLLMCSRDDRYILLGQQLASLQQESRVLTQKINRLKHLQEKKGGLTMLSYTKEEVLAFQKEAKEKWGDTEAYQDFAKRTQEELPSAVDDLRLLFVSFGRMQDLPADTEEVQAQVKALKDYISEHFYECTDDILKGLGELYVTDQRFTDFIDQAGVRGTANYVNKAIAIYVK